MAAPYFQLLIQIWSCLTLHFRANCSFSGHLQVVCVTWLAIQPFQDASQFVFTFGNDADAQLFLLLTR